MCVIVAWCYMFNALCKDGLPYLKCEGERGGGRKGGRGRGRREGGRKRERERGSEGERGGGGERERFFA